MVQSCRFVHQARISSGSGMLDFEPDIDDIKPDMFIVNHDGDTPDKRDLCKRKRLEYLVLPRLPKEGLPVRSSTASTS